MLPTQKSHSHGGHGHSHGHGHSSPQGIAQLATPQNIIHFTTVAISVILYYILFAWESLFINFVVLLIWSSLASMLAASMLRLPKSYWNQFCPRFVFISFIFFMIISALFGFNTLKESHEGELYRGQRFVHLDMKGAPPTITYLKKLIPLIKKLGGTGLLIEWEDTLPYTGEFISLRGQVTYSPEEIKEILNLAKYYELDVIPLVPTVGHLEFLLKHREFSSYREFPYRNDVISPSKSESVLLVNRLIEQVLSFHPNVDMVHLGGDQVLELGLSAESEHDLYLKYMVPLVRLVHAQGKNVLLWDDIMRRWSVSQIEPLQNLIEPVVWEYRGNVEDKISSDVFRKYKKVFHHTWASSSFKGSTGKNKFFTPVDKHLINQASWGELSKNENITFQGIFIIGWSRYSGESPLCETIPAAIPSLAMQLAVAKEGYYSFDMRKKVFSGLGLPNFPIESFESYVDQAAETTGRFPGSKAYKLLAQIQREKINYDKTKTVSATVAELLDQLPAAFNDILYPVHIQELRKTLEKQFGVDDE